MAIPFSLPSDDTTLEQYRTIHQLLLDLTAVLRTLLARNPEWVRSAETAATTHTANANAAAANLVANATANSDMMTNNTHAAMGRQPVATAAFNSAVPMPQFGLPLSPPNSQPGSPSPFFTATAGSAFVLPDVVCNAARTLNELTPQQMQPTGSPAFVRLAEAPATNAAAAAAAMAATAATSSNACNEPQNVSISQRLRKRKRVKQSKKKKSQDVDVGGCGSCEKLLRRKIPKTTYSCTCCCFVATVDQHHQQASHQQPSRPPHSGFCGQDNVTDADLPRTRMPTPMSDNECCCTQQLPVPSESDYKIPVCMHVGEELRKIVECFRNPRKMNGCISCTDDSADVKSSSFLSQFGRTVFTAALLVIGWKLLKQN